MTPRQNGIPPRVAFGSHCFWSPPSSMAPTASSAHPSGELALLDEAPACALRSTAVVARTGHAEDVADHHVVIPRNVLPQLAQKIVLLDTAWPHERADMVPVRTMQCHHRPIPTEAGDMAVLAQGDEIDQLHRPLADLQCLIHVERVHDHSGVLQPQRGYRSPFPKLRSDGWDGSLSRPPHQTRSWCWRSSSRNTSVAGSPSER